MPTTLVILAAGMGSRYGGLKQLDTFGPNNETLIEYAVYDAIRAGFSDVVFIIRKEIEQAFKTRFESLLNQHIKCSFVFQDLNHLPMPFKPDESRTKPWGTGHAIWCAKTSINNPFAMINADDFYGLDAYKTMHSWLSNQDSSALNASLVGYELKNTLSEFGYVSRGICEVDSNELLIKIVERTHIKKDEKIGYHFKTETNNVPLTGKELVSMNMIGFTPAIFEVLEKEFSYFLEKNNQELKSEFYIPTVIDKLIQNYEANVTVLKTEARTFGVTYAEDKTSVKNMLNTAVERGDYPKNLWL